MPVFVAEFYFIQFFGLEEAATSVQVNINPETAALCELLFLYIGTHSQILPHKQIMVTWKQHLCSLGTNSNTAELSLRLVTISSPVWHPSP